MKVLSVKVGYAYLICNNYKNIEHRSWSTDYRGRMLIHSCGYGSDFIEYEKKFPELFEVVNSTKDIKNKKYEKENNVVYALHEDYLLDLDNFFNILKTFPDYNNKEILQIPTKWIIGSVELYDIIKEDDKKYNWKLKNPILFEKPIMDIKGKLGIWDFPYTEKI